MNNESTPEKLKEQTEKSPDPIRNRAGSTLNQNKKSLTPRFQEKLKKLEASNKELKQISNRENSSNK